MTGREARQLFGDLVLSMHLPQPLHQLALSFCHLVYLLYATDDTLDNTLWSLVGKLHTFLHWPSSEIDSLSHTYSCLRPDIIA